MRRETQIRMDSRASLRSETSRTGIDCKLLVRFESPVECTQKGGGGRLFDPRRLSSSLSSHVGMNPFESFSCCFQSCLKAAMPAMIPTAMKHTLTKLQITPQHLELPPYRFANCTASEELTFLKIKSSQISQTLYSEDMVPMKSTTKRRAWA